MSKIGTAISLIKNNRDEFMLQIVRRFNFILSDKCYIKLFYRYKMGRKLDLKNPLSFTEKLQWLKLYDRNPLHVIMVDKEKVKPYVTQILGEEYVIPTLGVWDSFDDIDFDKLPNKFVLKTTNGGGSIGVVICHDKSKLDLFKAKQNIEKGLKLNLYRKLREWPYKGVKPRIIAEQMLEDKSGDLHDYKFYCFNGEPKFLLVSSNRFTNHNFTYFDLDFNKMDISSVMGAQSSMVPEKPNNFEEMKDVVKKLCKDMSHVRVDLYSCNNHVYFGEMTFYDSSGYDNFSSDEWDVKIGSFLTLPHK